MDPSTALNTIPTWLLRAAPRFARGDDLADRYKVIRVIRNGRKYQLLEVIGHGPLQGGDIHVCKAISKPNMSWYQRSHLHWMRSKRGEASKARLLHDFYDDKFCYLVFYKNHFTLAKVLASSAMMPLAPENVREISLQIMDSVKFLHRELKAHGDICPETIEFCDSGCRRDYVYNPATQENELQVVLTSTKIQLAFYGDFGRREHRSGTDQYRAPEIVFGGKISVEGDRFSVGCVLGELAIGEPIFPACNDGPLYRQEKALLFDAICGPFPEGFAFAIEEVYPNTFDDLEIRPICPDGVSPAIVTFLRTYRGLKYATRNNLLYDVLKSLLNCNAQHRQSVEVVSEYRYFEMVTSADGPVEGSMSDIAEYDGQDYFIPVDIIGSIGPEEID